MGKMPMSFMKIALCTRLNAVHQLNKYFDNVHKASSCPFSTSSTSLFHVLNTRHDLAFPQREEVCVVEDLFLDHRVLQLFALRLEEVSEIMRYHQMASQGALLCFNKTRNIQSKF